MMIGVLLLSWNVASVNVPRGLLQQPTDTLRLCAVGDLNLDRRVTGAGLLQGDTLYPFRPLLESLRVAWGDTVWIFPAIRALKASGRADLIVVSVHGGREYADEPPDYHRDLLYGLVDAGADLVLAHHPHVLQPVVWSRGKPIVQSLGNFVFVQSDPRTQLSAILRVAVAPNHRMRVSAVPVRVGTQPSLATGAAADSVRRRLHVRLSTPIPAKP